MATAPTTLLPYTVQFVKSGNFSAAAGKNTWVAPFSGTLVKWFAHADTAPTGQAAIFDVHKNGTTVFTTQANRPTIAASGTDASGSVIEVDKFEPGDVFRCDVDQAGSGTAGADAVLGFLVRVD